MARFRWWLVGALVLGGCGSTAVGSTGVPGDQAPLSLAPAPVTTDVVPASTSGSASTESTPTSTAPADPLDPVACPGVRCLSVVVTGDLLLHQPLWEQARADARASGATDEFDFAPLLDGQIPFLDAADVAVCHLETPLAPEGGPYLGYPAFSVPPQIARAAADAGYDACTTASNHSFDHGTAGIDRTLDTLDAAGLAHAGTARTREEGREATLIETSNGVVGLVSGTYGQNAGPLEHAWQVTDLEVEWLLSRAAAAKEAGADVVIVSVHAGIEYQEEPTPHQQELAEMLLASPDVDFVAGHHAHVVQPLEKFGDKWVAYGLGNSIAAHEVVDERNQQGLLVRVTFSQDAAGTWTTADLSWAPSVVGTRQPQRWCSPIVTPCEADPGNLVDRVAGVVNARGADQDGAHPYGG